MSGHSKWSTIKRKKGAADAKRGAVFTRLTREIVMSAREGGSDIDSNFRLRLAVDKARSENMPKDNIERAIKRGAGEDKDGVVFEQITYEGYAPHGVAVMVETVTDNRNRTVSDLRHAFSKAGGNMAEPGAVGWQFERVAYFSFPSSDMNYDKAFELGIDAGADDVVSSENGHEIYASQATFRDVAKALEAKFGEPRKAALIWKPQNTVAVDDETGEKLLKLMDLLNEHDDVQQVYANFEVSDALVAKMGG